jgi:hypothetical protein
MKRWEFKMSVTSLKFHPKLNHPSNIHDVNTTLQKYNSFQTGSAMMNESMDPSVKLMHQWALILGSLRGSAWG